MSTAGVRGVRAVGNEDLIGDGGGRLDADGAAGEKNGFQKKKP